ncbi:MAG: hypothetical protein KDC49_12510 [Saprospiraceae bacterium]|nr:hypothetical protein [Saprospiraceae bacterium]
MGHKILKMKCFSKFILLPWLMLIVFVQCSKQPSCSDGIQNGNELFPDCGGDCGPCYSFDGLYELVDYSVNRSNFFTNFNIEKIYLEFEGNQVKNIVADTKGTLNINSVPYTLGTSQNTITYNNTTLFITGLSDVEYSLGGKDENNNTIQFRMLKVTANLCAGLNCNNGSCQYGYCICNGGLKGRDCTIPAASAGPDIAIIVYDKGQFSNGWRYIEVRNESLSGKPWGCLNVDGLENTIGAGKANTEKIFAKCGNSAQAAKFALDYSISGYSDWYLPSRDELVKICENKSKISDFPTTGIGIWSSSDIRVDITRRLPVDLNARTCQTNSAGQETPYTIFLIRYF